MMVVGSSALTGPTSPGYGLVRRTPPSPEPATWSICEPGSARVRFPLEAYVNNVFNDTNYTSLVDNTEFDPIGGIGGVRANAALFVNLPDQRTAGVQLKVKF